jgi:hypothetical protein
MEEDFEQKKNNDGEIEAEFEGVSKKNTRKKKEKSSNMNAANDISNAFGDGEDSNDDTD